MQMQTHIDEPRRRSRRAPAVTALAAAGVMVVGFTQLGGASATVSNGGSACHTGTTTNPSATTLQQAGRVGVYLGQQTKKPRTVTKTVTRWRTTTKYRKVYKCVTVVETTTVLPDSVVTE
jgi:hypothetical protein